MADSLNNMRLNEYYMKLDLIVHYIELKQPLKAILEFKQPSKDILHA